MKDLPKLGYTSAREGIGREISHERAICSSMPRIQNRHFDRAGRQPSLVVDTGQVGVRAPRPSQVEVDKKRQTVELFDKSNALIGFYPGHRRKRGEAVTDSGRLKSPKSTTIRPTAIIRTITSRACIPANPSSSGPARTIPSARSGSTFLPTATASTARQRRGRCPKAESHGCVRLTNWDAERVADSVAKGTKVSFVDGPT